MKKAKRPGLKVDEGLKCFLQNLRFVSVKDGGQKCEQQVTLKS